MPLSELCELVRGEPRSWYYEEKPGPEGEGRRGRRAQGRDRAGIVSGFPGYGYRRVAQTLKAPRMDDRPQEGGAAAGDEKRVASVPAQTGLQADHGPLALSEDLPEPHQGYGGGRCSRAGLLGGHITYVVRLPTGFR